MSRSRLAALAAFALVACGGASGSSDAGTDAAADTIDAGHDAGTGSDAGRDAASDVGLDAGDLDSGDLDSGDFDSGDASLDAWEPDVGVIVPTPGRVAVGARHACAILPSGQAQCWGNPAEGALGVGPVSTAGLVPPTDVVGVTDAVAIGAGDGYGCALRSTGAVVCWGRCRNIGRMNLTPRCTGTFLDQPFAVLGVPASVALSVGWDHACALDAAGVAYCWGSGGDGQLGGGDPLAYAARQVTVAGPFAHIAAGNTWTCGVLLSDGSVWCWGNGIGGYLGDGRSGDYASAVAVRAGALADVDALSTSTGFTCAHLRVGGLSCWGSSTVFGSGPHATPMAFAAPSSARSFTTQMDGEVCVMDGPHALCASETSPLVRVGGLNGVLDAAAAGRSACALLSDGVYCWGDNAHGQCGTDTPSEVAPPQRAIAFP